MDKMASMPYVSQNGVQLITDFTNVWYAHRVIKINRCQLVLWLIDSSLENGFYHFIDGLNLVIYFRVVSYGLFEDQSKAIIHIENSNSHYSFL